jgi:hypothetical protein
VISFGGGDAQLHFVCGLLPALAVAWTFGQRWTWLGLAGIVVMGLLGGAAEWIQGAFSKRGVDMVDWVWHSVGCAAAIVPYLLARASRGSESADARRVHIPD